jgi:hypothetical protein
MVADFQGRGGLLPRLTVVEVEAVIKLFDCHLLVVELVEGDLC